MWLSATRTALQGTGTLANARVYIDALNEHLTAIEEFNWCKGIFLYPICDNQNHFKVFVLIYQRVLLIFDSIS